MHREQRIPGALVATLLLLLVAAGCKPATPGWPRLAPEPTPPGLWTEELIKNGWITVNVGLPHRGRAPFPVVLNPIVPDHLLLQRGIGVVRWKTNWEILAALAPGKAATGKASTPTPASPTKEDTPKDKVGLWLLQADRPGIVGREYFGLITTEAHDTIPRVIDHLLKRPDVDPHRIAITGSSTSGFTALQALAEDPRLALGVVQVACGDYRLFLRSSSLGLDDQERWLVDGEMVLDADYTTRLESIEPVSRVDHFPPRPLLMLSGAQDRAIPAACVQETAARLGRAYEAASVPDRFEWVDYEARGHNMGPEALPVILDFLERWLEISPGSIAP